MTLFAELSSFPSSEPTRSISPARMGAPAFAQLTRTIQWESRDLRHSWHAATKEFRLHHKVVAAWIHESRGYGGNRHFLAWNLACRHCRLSSWHVFLCTDVFESSRPAPLVLSATWDPKLVEIWDRTPRHQERARCVYILLFFVFKLLCFVLRFFIFFVFVDFVHRWLNWTRLAYGFCNVAASALYPVRKEWKPCGILWKGSWSGKLAELGSIGSIVSD